MEILVRRKIANETATISQLSVDGVFECYCLEDTDRGLRKEMPLSRIKRIKVHSQTAIPTGRYQVVLSHSVRFKRVLPELLSVPGFLGIRIHSGNSSANTEGCLLTGTWDEKAVDWISGSRIAFDKLFAKMQAAVKRKEEIWITIEKGYSVAQHEVTTLQMALASATEYKEHGPESLMA